MSLVESSQNFCMITKLLEVEMETAGSRQPMIASLGPTRKREIYITSNKFIKINRIYKFERSG